MANASVITLTPAQIEPMNKTIQELTSIGGDIEGKLVKGSGPEIEGNNRPARIPFLTRHSMGGSKFSPDGGDLPFGLAVGTAAYFGGHIPYAHSAQLTLAQRDMNNLSTVDANKEVFGRQAEMINVKHDIMFHGDGSGILAGAAGGSTTANIVESGVTKTTYTFASASDFIGVVNMVEGLPVEVVASNLSTRRAPASGTDITYVEKINWFTNTVTLNQEITGASAGDVFAWPGLFAPTGSFVAGYSGAATLSSFNSAYPTGPTAAATGFTGDPFRHGYQYALNTDPTSYFFSVQRSTYPILSPNSLSVGGAFQYIQMLMLLSQIQYRRPSQADSLNHVGLLSPEQFIAAFDAGTAVTETMRSISDQYGKTPDMTPDNRKYSDSVIINGITCYKDRRAKKNQIVLLLPDKIGKVVGKKLEIYNPAGGNGFMALPSTNGTISTNIAMWMTDSWDYMYYDPGSFGILDNLTVPSIFS